MNQLTDNKREILPRWRDTITTVLVGELAPKLSRTATSTPSSDFLSPKLREWKQQRELSLAEEVVAAAFVLNRPDEAREAAEFVLANQTYASAAADLARRILGYPRHATLEFTRENVQADVRRLKAILRTDPKDAFAWVDLARDYSVLGVKTRAIQGIKNGMALAPDNRHVLRSASRFYSHVDDPIIAHRLLMRSDATPYDPWLIAAEISAAALASRQPMFAKTGLRLLDSRNFSPFDLSELASALGTLEAQNGSHRLSRRHFRTSLVNPNENSVAQARWAATSKIIEIDESIFKLKNAYEARAWHSFYTGKWKNALASSRRWLKDQPFSAGPVVHASYLATVALQDYKVGIEILEHGLMANPNEPIMLNNLAYALANLGRLTEAESTLERIQTVRSGNLARVSIPATRGLIAFRRGDPLLGRRFYERAAEEARAQGDKLLVAKVSLFWATEELTHPTEGVLAIAQDALTSSAGFNNSDFLLLRERLKTKLAEYQSRGIGGSGSL